MTSVTHRTHRPGLRPARMTALAIMLSAAPWAGADLRKAAAEPRSCTVYSSTRGGSLAAAEADARDANGGKASAPLVRITRKRWSADGQRLVVSVRWNRRAIVRSGVHARSVNLVATLPEGVLTIPFDRVGPYRSRITLTADQVLQVKQASTLAVAATQKQSPKVTNYFDQAYVYVAYLRGGPAAEGQGAPPRNCSRIALRANGDYSGCSLSGANLNGMVLNSANFEGADLTGAQFGKAQSSDWGKRPPCADTDGCDAADLTNGRFPGANLSGVSMTGTILNGANLASANLSNTDLTGAYLNDANLTGANLRGVGLGGAQARRACFKGADLRPDSTGYANSYAFLAGTDLAGSSLENADFTAAMMEGSDLRCTHVTGSTFKGADMQDANLKSAAPLGKAASTDGVLFNAGTICPNGTAFPDSFCPASTWNVVKVDDYCTAILGVTHTY